MGGELRVRNGSIGLHVKYVVDQKWVILSGLKRTQVNRVAGWIRLTCIFHMIFFFFFNIRKTTCICHLKSYAINYLM